AAEQRAQQEPDLRTMDEIGLLQDVRLVQSLHGRSGTAETMDVPLFDACKQEIVHDLARAHMVRHHVIHSASHDSSGSPPTANLLYASRPAPRKQREPYSRGIKPRLGL